jgi:putative transposase
LGRGITVGHGAVELLMHRAGIKGLPGNSYPSHIPRCGYSTAERRVSGSW